MYEFCTFIFSANHRQLIVYTHFWAASEHIEPSQPFNVCVCPSPCMYLFALAGLFANFDFVGARPSARAQNLVLLSCSRFATISFYVCVARCCFIVVARFIYIYIFLNSILFYIFPLLLFPNLSFAPLCPCVIFIVRTACEVTNWQIYIYTLWICE